MDEGYKQVAICSHEGPSLTRASIQNIQSITLLES